MKFKLKEVLIIFIFIISLLSIIKYSIIYEQRKSIIYLSKKIELMEKQNTKKVTITFYHPWSKGINSDSDPNNTAIMVHPTANKTCAISRDLVYEGWLSHKVYIEGYGIFVAEDIMNDKLPNGKIIKNHIDICVESLEKAKLLGIKRNITAVKLFN